MTNVDVAYVNVTRTPEVTNVDVAYVNVTRTPPVVVRNVDISHFSITRGFSPPFTNGGVRVRVGGEWRAYTPTVRFDGQWQ